MRLLTALLLLGSNLITGCSDSKFAGLSDAELRDRYSQCAKAKSLAPGGAITCDNINRECERRADDVGHRVCY